MAHTKRVVVLVDMDCFYCQVEEMLDPKLQGKPVAVVQYNEWRGGGIIAVNYPARDSGVTRHMRGDEAKKVCPDIQLVRVPQIRGKADLTKYRDAGKRVADVLQTFTPFLERASVDEAYLDITQAVEKRIEEHCEVTIDKLKNTHVVGSELADFVDNIKYAKTYDEDLYKLAVGGMIAEEIRAAVYRETGYRCSAGIAHNKILAKLVCGLHKPNKQTLLPQSAVAQLYRNMPVKKVKSLGGKFGAALSESLGITNMGELIRFTEDELAKMFDDKTATWLYNIARGIDLEPVTIRLVPKSIGCSKNFRGKSALFTEQQVEHWLEELSDELASRLQKDFEENNRRAKLLSVNFSQRNVSSTRSCPFGSYDQQTIAKKAIEIIKKNCRKDDGTYHITHLGLNMTNFEDTKNIREITSFFKNKTKSPSTDEQNSSIFSCSTQEDDVNRDTLVYYEDVHPESIADQCFPNPNSSTDSISPEMCERPPSTSFFESYFSKNLKRDFDTSRILETGDEESQKIEEQEFSVEKLSQVANCAECGKKIPVVDFQCHMDYHYAISIVKNEAHVYKTPATDGKVTKSVGKKRKSKQKSPKCDTKPLLSYFKRASDDDGGEMCTQCSKRIKIEDMSSHMDYHAAKKLHLELNSKPLAVTTKK